MLQIIWDYKNYKDNKIEFYEEDRESANNLWQYLSNDPDVSNVRTSGKKAKRYIAVKVTFTNGGKPYTYLAKSMLNPGDLAMVYTSEGREIVKVIECTEMEESALEKIYPVSKLKYISGKIVAA